EFDGSQDFDVMLRTTERARTIVHIPRLLYHWRAVAGSAAGDTNAKPWAYRASKRVMEDTVRRRGLDATVESTKVPGMYHLRRRVADGPRVVVIIPFRDQAAMTARCLSSLSVSPGYENFEVLLVDNGSTEPEAIALVDRARRRSIRVLDHPGEFNWSVINNVAAGESDADLLLFMNNDIEATGSGWMKALVELAQVPEVGAVGAKLVFPDGILQHGGIVVGMGGIAGHLFCGMPPGGIGYLGWAQVIRPCSAVTGACMMTRKEVFDELGGFDEELEVAFNDVDYCMRLNDSGYRVLYTPLAELVHDESVTRGLSGYVHDVNHFLRKWSRDRLRRDPFYNPNLTLFHPWCSLRPPEEAAEWEERVDMLTGAA
ncbi:MAG: glycosyltransferase family 2 protein, partial [Acidimicrobiales bacterium]